MQQMFLADGKRGLDPERRGERGQLRSEGERPLIR